MQLAAVGRVAEAAGLLAHEAEAATDPEEKGAALVLEGNLLLQLREFGKVRECIKEANRVLPRDRASRMSLIYLQAAVDYAEGEQKDALRGLERLEEQYSHLLALPEYRYLREGAELRRGILLTWFSRFDEALGFLERALGFETEEKDAHFYLSLANCYFFLGRPAEAEPYFLRALQVGLTPYWEVKAREFLGAAYHRRQAYALAKTQFEWCLAHHKDSDIPERDLLKWLASTSRMLNLPDEAAIYERKARESDN